MVRRERIILRILFIQIFDLVASMLIVPLVHTESVFESMKYGMG
jgi:hypothetical protein